MNVIIIKEKNSNDISELVKTLKDLGYKVGIDFDFEYSPGNWDYETGHVPRQTKFTFYNERLAVLFALRWAS